MPLINGKDVKGCYYKWGKTGHKYHYTAHNPVSRAKAKNKAILQAMAIKYHRGRGGTSSRQVQPIYTETVLQKAKKEYNRLEQIRKNLVREYDIIQSLLLNTPDHKVDLIAKFIAMRDAKQAEVSNMINRLYRLQQMIETERSITQ
jgi:hypothetical protein